MTDITLISLLLFFWSEFAHAWGDVGHRSVSEAAQNNLKPPVVKAIAKILGSQGDLPPNILAHLSMWPDLIRPLAENPDASLHGFTLEELQEAKEFVHHHPDNTDWHFVDLPPGCSMSG